ncbi:MAG: PilZ domain-containing protein [Spirochaetes bacterium]|nr:PilZ domain-containing protein [Spirochaetota bacterium]
MVYIKRLEDYLKSHSDAQGGRRYLRIPSKIPVLYAFKNRNRYSEYRQSFTTNISTGGLSIEVIGPPSVVLKNLSKLNKTIELKVDIPQKKSLIDFSGKVEWVETLQKDSPGRYLVGISFDTIKPDDRIDILSYSVRLVNRKKMARLALGVLAAGILISGLWAIGATQSKKQVQKKLVISETAREKLKKDIIRLGQMKDGLEQKLELNQIKIISQSKLLESQKKTINEKNQTIKGMSLYLNNSKILLEDIYKEWNIDSRSDFIVFDDLYRKGRQALKDGEYPRAILTLEELIKKYPNSLLGYRLLISALYKEGKKEQADKMFQEYIAKLKEQVIQP